MIGGLKRYPRRVASANDENDDGEDDDANGDASGGERSAEGFEERSSVERHYRSAEQKRCIMQLVTMHSVRYMHTLRARVRTRMRVYMRTCI